MAESNGLMTSPPAFLMSLASPFFSPRAAGRSAVSLVSPASFQLFKHISQISFQLLHAHVFGTAQIKMKHWMLDLFLLIICNGQSFEKFFPSLKISLKGRGKKKISNRLGRLRKTYFIFFSRKSTMYLVLST